MTIRIESLSDGDQTLLQVSGDLRKGGVSELARVCRETTGPLALDLSDVRFAGPEGVRLISMLAARGVRICGLTPYLEFLLNADRK